MTCVVDEDEDLQFFTHKLVVPKRDEDVPIHSKEISMILIERTFNKDKSVFADWKSDTDETGINCINHDLELWHGDKFIKDEEDLEATANVMRKYAREIKNIYIQAASHGSFPQIGWIDFTAFSAKCRLADEKGEGNFV